MAIDIGLIAYNKYKETIKSASKQICLPEWGSFSKVEQDAWREAAVAVLQYVNAERDKLDGQHYDEEAIY